MKIVTIYLTNELIGVSGNIDVEQLSEHVFKMHDNEIFDCRLTYGTEFETRINANGAHEILRILKESPYETRRFMLNIDSREPVLRQVGDELIKMGGFWQTDFGGILTVNMPKDSEISIQQLIERYNLRVTEIVDDTPKETIKELFSEEEKPVVDDAESKGCFRKGLVIIGTIMALFLMLVVVPYFANIVMPWQRAEAIHSALSWGYLAELPADAQNISVKTQGGIFTRQYIVTFACPGQSLQSWIKHSTGLQAGYKEVDDATTTLYRVHGRKASIGGTVRIYKQSNMVVIDMSWS